jgi:glycosyltransferase involved in cell wall biosynthesis
VSHGEKMKEIPYLSVIIAVYKNIRALEWLFRGLERQSFQHFEVIIAEDDDSPLVSECIKNARQR